MRWINKEQRLGSYHLQQRNQNPPASPEEATTAWGNLNSEYKADLRDNYLLDEQLGLCAYSEIAAKEYALGFHIEHVENKSQNPQRTFDYHNLVASAINDERASRLVRQDVFGGHAIGKKQGCDMQKFISCLDPCCSKYFAYLSDGHIVPMESLTDDEKAKAQYTINLLNLDSPYLVNLRKNWIDELDSLIDEHIEKAWSLLDLRSIYLEPTGNQRYSFFSAAAQRLRHIS